MSVELQSEEVVSNLKIHMKSKVRILCRISREANSVEQQSQKIISNQLSSEVRKLC